MTDAAAALVVAGRAHERAGGLAQAAACYQRALVLAPSQVEAHVRLGLLAQRQDDPARAAEHLRRAAALRPDSADVQTQLGIALAELGETAAALPHFERAAALRPNVAEMHNNLGSILYRLRRSADALACFQRALAMQPDYPLARVNRALALVALDRPAEALVAAQGVAGADGARAAALAALGRDGEAREAYHRALAQAPGDARLAMTLAGFELRLGRLAESWSHYRRRAELPEFRRTIREHKLPLWHGEALGGRTLLVQAEQGLGDTLQFCRYLPLLAGRGRVVFEVQRPLLPLLAGLPGAAQMMAPDDPPPPAALQTKLLDLPGIFGTTLATIPPPAPLRPDPARLAAWAARLPRDGRLRVGLAWSGSLDHPDDRNRSMPLAALRPLAAAGAAFFVVQKGVRESDRAALRDFPGLVDPGPQLADFADTAALVAQLDLVISVDTAPAHLAATLGRPTWVLLGTGSDWRWLLDRADSPWYPSVRLFRTPPGGGWADVAREVAAALAAVGTERRNCADG